jgi:hypothetical protein
MSRRPIVFGRCLCACILFFGPRLAFASISICGAIVPALFAWDLAWLFPNSFYDLPNLH